MKVGVIGLPYSGKTTLWRLLTETLEPEVHSGPKPRVKTVRVEDSRLERLRADYQPKKYTPAQVELHDLKGVAADEADRSGLADLLAPARDMDALLVVLRGFSQQGRTAPDPAAEWKEIQGELLLSDLVIVERRLEKLEVQLRKRAMEEDRREKDLLLRLRAELEAERDLAAYPLAPDERKRLGSYMFLSQKPKVPVLNREESPPRAQDLAALAAVTPAEPAVVCALQELEILQLPPEERGAFLEEFGISEPARQGIIGRAYRAAGRISFFTAGDKEVRAWTIRNGATAVEAAGEIHSDIQRGFIRAELVSYEDYARDGGIKGAKERHHFRLEGKDYRVQDGDIIEFRFSV